MSTPHVHDGPRSIGALLRAPAGAINRALLHGLTRRFPEMRQSYQTVFQHIDHPPAGTRLTELAQRTMVSKQALVEAVDGMEAAGFLDRIPDPTDRRAKLIRLTAKGMEVHDTAMAIAREIESEWAAMVGESALRDLRAILERLSAALELSTHGEDAAARPD